MLRCAEAVRVRLTTLWTVARLAPENWTYQREPGSSRKTPEQPSAARTKPAHPRPAITGPPKTKKLTANSKPYVLNQLSWSTVSCRSLTRLMMRRGQPPVRAWTPRAPEASISQPESLNAPRNPASTLHNNGTPQRDLKVGWMGNPRRESLGFSVPKA